MYKSMDTLYLILLATFAGSLLSLVGGVLLLFKKNLSHDFVDYLSAFAAGTLLGTAFLDLLPEALEAGDTTEALTWALIGILLFFLLERFIHWFHHHHEHVGEIQKPSGALIIAGDSIHNFIDGVAIALTFMIDPAAGILATIAIGAHEIPQEIGDFGILLKAGYSKRRVLLYNVLSACTAFAGALITYAIGPSIEEHLSALIGITAGFFIYIALSDLVPEIHAWGKKKLAVAESALLLLGIVVVGALVRLLE